MNQQIQPHYWWVSQNQTFRQEFEGGYLWSPQFNKNGGIVWHYETMKEVEPGDKIFSFCDTFIKAIGIARSHAYPATKPDEFGSAGSYWDKIGWRIDVQYFPLVNQISPREYIEVLRDLLPEKHSPLQKNGNGNQMYLASISHGLAAKLEELIGEEAKMQVLQHLNFETWTSDNYQSVRAKQEKDLIGEIRAMDISDTERRAMVKARIGQGKFKDNVMKFEKGCRITGVKRIEHLRASHIKPWRFCSTAQERLHGANGLLLTPTIDHLFDRGFISFEKSGEILIAKKIDTEIIRKMGIDPCKSAGDFNSDQDSYLQFHRDSIFLQSKQ